MNSSPYLYVGDRWPVLYICTVTGGLAGAVLTMVKLLIGGRDALPIVNNMGQMRME